MLGELTILLYHGVTEAESFGIENYHNKHIRAELFDEQMKFVKENCNVLSIDEVVEHYAQRKPFPENACVVTFDDGFENNYSVAAPILSHYNIPATFYITSGIIDSKKMFWVDELEDVINLTEKQTIDTEIGGQWLLLSLKTLDEKIEALEKIKSFCKNSSAEIKDQIVRSVIQQTQITPSVEHAANYRKISSMQLREMNSNSLFTIGGHSAEHNILSKLSNDEMRVDIKISIEILCGILNRQIRHYAYPEGQAEHFNQNVISTLKTHGIACCPSAMHGTNNGSEDLFHLKRIMVGFKGTKFPFEIPKTTFVTV